MESAIGIAMLVGIIAAYGGWVAYLKASVKPRTTSTRIEIDQIRGLFVDKVARLGWQVVDWDDPMVAQSPLIAGRRQQLAIKVDRRSDGGYDVTIAPVRLWTKGFIGVPYKAHTLRMRMNSFISAVNAGQIPKGSGRIPARPVDPSSPMAPAPILATPTTDIV